MIVTPTDLPDVLIIEPRVFRDERGFFLETFNADRFVEHGLPVEFRQDNHSRSARGVLRGLHYQFRRPQGKLLTVMSGEIFDVAVDIRRGSPTFGRHQAITLTEEEKRFVWIPPGFAHGFCVLSDFADVVYKCTRVYDPADERGIAWNDPVLKIRWPLTHPILSPKDQEFLPLDSENGDLPLFTDHGGPPSESRTIPK